MIITSVHIKGIKSHKDTLVSLEEYTVVVGENNSGKSNLLYALRWFFNEIKLKREDIFNGYTNNPEVRVIFKKESTETVQDIEEEFIKDGYFEIIATCKLEDLNSRDLPPTYDLVKDGNKKSLKKINFLDLIFVPSVRELKEEFKNTNTSTISRLLSIFVIDRVKKEEEKNKEYAMIKSAIEELSSFMSEGQNSAFNKLSNFISENMICYKDIKLKFKLEPPTVEELIKNSYKVSIENSNGNLPLESQGMGFQRLLIFALICCASKIEEMTDKLRVYLIEEPELFLHPNLQTMFRDNLMLLSNKKNNQILLTSHSPYFLNNITNYSQIKRISLKDNCSLVNQISHEVILDICKKNGRLLSEAIGAAKTPPWDEIKIRDESEKIAREDELRYLLWVDPERANAFLSKKIILVEGKTEKAFFSYLFNNEKGNLYSENKYDLSIIDVNGKYHFYKFAQLLYNLKIPCWIFYDGDNDSTNGEISHEKLNIIIESMKRDNIIVDTFRIDPYLEEFLGLEKSGKALDIKLYHNLCENKNNCLCNDNYQKIIYYIKENILKY